MNVPLFVPYLSLLVLDDDGLSLRSSMKNEVISKAEIIGIGNFYSPVISASSPQLEIYGPLPIPHFEKYHLLIVSFRKLDTKLINPRTKFNGNLAFCQLLVFYNKEADQTVKFGHNRIFKTIEEFLSRFDDIQQITEKELHKLSENLIENVLLDENIKSKSIEDIVRDFASRFNTIQQISSLLNRRTKVGIITSDSFLYNLIIQSLFHYQNIDFIYQFDRNEYVTRIDTYFMRIVLTLLFDLEIIAGKEFFREMDYYIYVASCENNESTSRHIQNIDSLRKSDTLAKFFFVTTEKSEDLPLETKKYLFNEIERRKNIDLLVSIGDTYRTLDNAIYLVLNDILELRNILSRKKK
ncbi:MAG: hypothetical protein ACTSP3_14750 [Candidatus Heimdallarchaeaceae archaeon]